MSFYRRTYNVLETTSTNTKSTSSWSLRNSWMQYITLTLPCLDSGRQGPEREKHTGWAADAVRRSRSSDLTVACKKQSGLHFSCNSNCSKVMKQLKTLKSSRGLLWNDHLVHSKTIFYSDYYLKKACAYLSQRACKPEVSLLNPQSRDSLRPGCLSHHTKYTLNQVKVRICEMMSLEL